MRRRQLSSPLKSLPCRQGCLLVWTTLGRSGYLQTIGSFSWFEWSLVNWVNISDWEQMDGPRTDPLPSWVCPAGRPVLRETTARKDLPGWWVWELDSVVILKSFFFISVTTLVLAWVVSKCLVSTEWMDEWMKLKDQRCSWQEHHHPRKWLTPTPSPNTFH